MTLDPQGDFWSVEPIPTQCSGLKNLVFRLLFNSWMFEIAQMASTTAKHLTGGAFDVRGLHPRQVLRALSIVI